VPSCAGYVSLRERRSRTHTPLADQALHKNKLAAGRLRVLSRSPSQDYMSTMGFRGECRLSGPCVQLPEEVLPRRKTDTSPKRVVGVGLFDYEGRGNARTVQKHVYDDYIRKLSEFVAWCGQRVIPYECLSVT